MEIFLPFGAYSHIFTNEVIFTTFESSDRHEELLKIPYKLYYVTFFSKEEYGKNNTGIELTFPATIFPQFVTKNRGFIYKWNKDSVTIRKLVGTTKTTELKNQVKLLLEECKRFYLIYCTQ